MVNPIPFKDVVPDLKLLMGVKAVWGRSQESVMCFGSRGDPEKNDRGHFSQARRTAERAMKHPYFITIGAVNTSRLNLMAVFWSSPWVSRISVSSPLLGGYDEPEILLYSIAPICPIGADAAHLKRHRRVSYFTALLWPASCGSLSHRRQFGSHAGHLGGNKACRPARG